MSTAVEEVRAELREAGFKFIRRTKHQWLYRDDLCNFVGVPTSPSDHRALDNCRADIRRAVRQREALAPVAAKATQQHREEPAVNHVAIDNPPTIPLLAETKTCKKCGRDLPLSHFHVSGLPNQNGRRINTCTPCVGRAVSAAHRTVAPKAIKAKPTRVAPQVSVEPVAKSATEPEVMATRVLLGRHREEYEALLADMMVALGWGQ